jgi:AcrR family transcriptional regulator
MASRTRTREAAGRRTAPTPEPAGRGRAAALPPSERRAAIVDATLPLLLAHGPAVTTRQIAEAAGVAEGTIFRVFPDKQSLIEAVVDAAFDMTAINEALAEIDPSLALEQRLVEAVEILRRRFAELHQLRAVVEAMQRAGESPALPPHRLPPDLSGVAALFEPDRERLRRSPIEAAYLLRGMTLAGTHPALILDEPLPSSEIVSLFLDGIREAEPGEPAERSRATKTRGRR